MLPQEEDSAWEEVQLSSGFEDYYLSGQYFDAGEFSTVVTGIRAKTTGFTRMHDNLDIIGDPVVFEEGIALKWRNGLNDHGKLAAGVTQQTLSSWHVEQ